MGVNFMRLAYVSLAALALASAAPAMAQNLIQNGDFSAGLNNWSLSNDCCWYIDGNGFRDGEVGDYSYLSQTFSDTAGGALTLDFDFWSDAGSQFVLFNGVQVPNSFVGPENWTHYTFNLGLATGSDTITFRGRNDPSYNALTHVSVTESGAVPEPASWALMLGGFGMVGGALRSRKAKVAFA